jgi:hypothetical protein
MNKFQAHLIIFKTSNIPHSRQARQRPGGGSLIHFQYRCALLPKGRGRQGRPEVLRRNFVDLNSVNDLGVVPKRFSNEQHGGGSANNIFLLDKYT